MYDGGMYIGPGKVTLIHGCNMDEGSGWALLLCAGQSCALSQRVCVWMMLAAAALCVK